MYPLRKTVANLDLSISCVFENRHKFLCALETLLELENIKLCGAIEIDETYELESQKGKKKIKRKARKRGKSSQYRGISHEQIRIIEKDMRHLNRLLKKSREKVNSLYRWNICL